MGYSGDIGPGRRCNEVDVMPSLGKRDRVLVRDSVFGPGMHGGDLSNLHAIFSSWVV
ncbi:hypothetical protein BH39T_PBIAJDOK_02722 [Barrientosiimonas humi]|nr:hypothetical protein BH39T_PBIAJDOK_02722 [Barrientosiimonas humi]